MATPALNPPPTPDVSPLTVELEGVLARTNTLHEGLVRLLKRRPHLLPAAVGWSLKGPAFLRAQVARHVDLDVARLPYDEALVSRLTEEKSRGRRIVLATVADRRVAEAVAAHLGFFDQVLASDGERAMTGPHRTARLRETLGEPHEEARPLHAARPLPRTLLKALRVHQWAKNVLVFVPLMAAHKLTHVPLLIQALLGFIAFSLCASSVYVLNDLLDLDSDRKHPSKRRRPFASGDLPIRAGPWLGMGLLGAGAAVAMLLPREFLALLATYYTITLAYSFYLKQVVMMDVLVLAGLYTVRIFGGALAVGVPTSSWLLTFSMFIFLSLALVKRLSEVRRLRLANESAAPGRGYVAGDYEQLSASGVASGYLAVLVLALYITSKEVTVLYSHPERLWLLCPVMLYWVGRVWLLAHRGEVNEDPLVFALKDKVSYAVGAIAAGILLLAA
ncbi:UbiA family prenyltransferase [Melittangium boletus]|uniref:Integral membrane protein n=2 Tax=Melittangium boletus TaxID=83453 RepID=A0A250IB09_9BACT|nr:UbiA family prenyltransferase [Melittangium boletus]ATB28935.1 integral membrane protein [Melittangium boletus DSM 14713]AYM53185.1 transmembrane protein [Melittangium boletus]